MSNKTKVALAKLDEPVTLASSSPAMLSTREAGRVIGWGCGARAVAIADDERKS